MPALGPGIGEEYIEDRHRSGTETAKALHGVSMDEADICHAGGLGSRVDLLETEEGLVDADIMDVRICPGLGQQEASPPAPDVNFQRVPAGKRQHYRAARSIALGRHQEDVMVSPFLATFANHGWMTREWGLRPFEPASEKTGLVNPVHLVLDVIKGVDLELAVYG